ncbi:YhzD family protein [Neobacillus sp. PS3-34]|uniref:YhzD family protein n=1 Tax=Neobacillus sp. PS3-34 TaxID=3070678 RepID=UPI0027DF99B5|nr:YhzD family protein [Neobacillus sp. PS3-34]WML49660.1 YhzD family protein [Neobacillus sp. PS3-34]
MMTYKLTVFEQDGEKILEESFQAANDDSAKEIGGKMLEEKNFQDKTHRCASPAGKLILFHS